MHFGIDTNKIQMIKLLINDKITKRLRGDTSMKKRFHLFIIMGILIVGFIVGSFLDLQIDQALFQKNNGFGLFMAVFGVYPCYMGMAFVGGAFLTTTLRRKDMHIIWQLLGYGLSALALVLAVWLCGRELPSPNGYNNPKLAIISYAICAVVFSGFYVLGYFVARKLDAKQLWPILLVMAFIFIMALIPAGYLIKLVIHRPRYRYAVRTELTAFYNWWQMFPEYKNYISSPENPIFVEGFEITKEEFKSFPSGHSGAGMILVMVLPYLAYFFPKLKDKQTLLFYGGALFGFVMMFSRLLVGAHYLTDTCMGSLIVLVVYYVANEFAYRKGFFDEPKQEEAVPAQQ